MGCRARIRRDGTWDRDVTISALDTRKRRFYESSSCSFILDWDFGDFGAV